MADEADAIWRAFLTETEEHLEIADALLSRGNASFAGDDIGTLFRAFHSLKGLSQAMDLANMQVIAHHAEDLLSLIRDDRVSLDEQRTSMLLEVVDRLRGMREWAEVHRADPSPSPDLVERLAQMVVRDSETAAMTMSAAVEPSAAPALTEDEEMLGIYCELLAERVPTFVDALVSGDGAATAGDADELVHGADVIGLDQLAGDLRNVANHARALEDEAARPALLLALANLCQQLSLLEELSGVPAGAAALGKALEAHAKQDAAARVTALRQALDGAGVDQTRLGALIGIAAAARSALDAGGMPLAAANVLLLEEQISRVAQGEVVWTAALASLARDMVRAVDGLETDLEPSEAASLHIEWQGRMRGDVPATPTDGHLRQALPPELRAALTDLQFARLDQRVTEGWHVFNLLLDTENEPDIAGDLTAWLAANTDVITTRTVNASGMSWFEFLFATLHLLDQVRNAITALDPDQRCFRGLREISTEGSGPADSEAPVRVAETVIRVRVDAVENLMDGLDEMRVMLGSLSNALSALGGEVAAASGHIGSAARPIEEQLTAAKDIWQRVDAMHRHVRAACIDLRVVPVDTVFARFPRIVRDLAQRLQREVEFEIDGRDARLDKSMADLLVDPLMHLVRNALDHGIEPPAERVAAGKPRRARLTIGAAQNPDGIHISVRDDGRGLDRVAIQSKAVERGLVRPDAVLSDHEIYDLLFRGGFSTAAEVTEISGRGVGLDVVAHVIGRIGGTIEIETVAGHGTTFTLRVPASASLQDVLLMKAGELIAIPERRVSGVIELGAVERIGTSRVVWYREEPVPVHDLAELLGFSQMPPVAAVLIADGGRLVALAVEQVPERREVFIKELHPVLAGIPAIAGATLLSDGNAVLILDLDDVLARCHSSANARATA
jgi:two-component system, chemotaxis family, sensor kinase CheA